MQYLTRLLLSTVVLTMMLGLGTALQAQNNSADPDADSAPPATDNNHSAASADMTVARLDELLRQLDSDLVQEGPTWRLRFQERTMIVVADGNADRMRIMIPITKTGSLDEAELYRLLQANFDSALDARYAVAQDTLWSIFIHPLSPLDEPQLASALFQVYSTAITFGTIYSSGQFTYGGGDSNAELERLREELERITSPRT